MNCWVCGKAAVGTCRFCGRAVCKDHVRTMPFILSLYNGEGNVPKAIVVSGALFCGVCKPQPSPIEMPELA